MPSTSQSSSRRPSVSRRRITQGIAWSAPAVAVAAAAPAQAASVCTPGCYPLQWTTTGSGSNQSQTLSSSANGSEISVEVTPVVMAGYSLPGGASYTPLNLTSSNGSVALSAYADPAGTVAVRTANYAALRLDYPACASGPVTFTVSGIDSYTTSATSTGAQYFTDSVQVVNDGVVVAPVRVSSVSVANGWATASSTTAGTATYTVADPGALEIRLRNAFTGTIPAAGHPNQTVQISAMACASAPPAPSCKPLADSAAGIYYDWGKDAASATTTDQTLFFAGSGGVSGLPADAQITSITWELTVMNRDDSVNGGRGPGAYEPSNSKLCNEPSGLTCSVNYGNISGCDYTPYYDDRRLGQSYMPTVNPTGTKALLYNGGGQTTGSIWNPKLHPGTVSVKLVSNWQTFDFQNGVVAPAWTVRFTGDAATAQSMLQPDTNGCLGFTKEASKDTPRLNLVYCGVKPAAAATSVNAWGKFTVVYTSGGQTYTIGNSQRFTQV